MIDRDFWVKIAYEWKKPDDGLNIPEIDENNIDLVNPDEDFLDGISSTEIDDILSDLDDL